MIDKSIYKKDHDKVIDFIMEQSGVVLNDYRDGNGTDPYTTTYWDINRVIKNKIMQFCQAKGMLLEQGGSWFYYISFAK